ncbi:unnamed protein product [Candidula unifasciata]|uniref:Replication termination factor 2 n=1 Tax=Candidula unifasciata TaxID=100452 RepID=A0A8S3YLP9_9EUPU|nr:unnamed protein product [Candidula unifasciata]
MGCDGGTIPKRDELVRTKKKPEQKDKTSELAFKWKHCAISQEALVKPIVACELGRLYNKEAVLEFLLDRSKFEVAAQFDHLRVLKDIKELNLTDNPESRSRDADKGDSFIDHNISDFICPVVGIEMNGNHKFCFLWSCGCVLSERALKEVKSETCHKCGKQLSEDDIVILNGTEEDVVEMKDNMEKRRALLKASKKTKKAEKHKLTGAAAPESTVGKKRCPGSAASSSSSVSNSTQSKPSSGPGKLQIHKSGNGKLPANKKKPEDSKGNGICSLQNNPNSSKTFKSLFTSSEAGKSQKQAHWVTYNPLYF